MLNELKMCYTNSTLVRSMVECDYTNVREEVDQLKQFVKQQKRTIHISIEIENSIN